MPSKLPLLSSIAKKSLKYTLKIKSNNNKIAELETEIKKLENNLNTINQEIKKS